MGTLTSSPCQLGLGGRLSYHSLVFTQDSRWRKKTHVPTTLNAPTARESIRLIVMSVYSGSIDSTDNGTQRRCKSSEKSELIQFTQLWVATNYVN